MISDPENCGITLCRLPGFLVLIKDRQCAEIYQYSCAKSEKKGSKFGMIVIIAEELLEIVYRRIDT